MSETPGGIPDGARWTPVPDLLIARLLPEMSDPLMVKAALHVLWRMHRRERGSAPALRRSDLVADPVLHRGAAALGIGEDEIEARVEAALGGLVERGLMLELRLAGQEEPERWLVVNGREGRALVRRLEAGEQLLPDAPPASGGQRGERSNIYALYEANIGMLTPMLAEELADAEATYPADWIEEALRIAAESNVRKWSYVRAILERWARDGRGGAPSGEGRQDEADRRADQTHRGKDRPAPYVDLIER